MRKPFRFQLHVVTILLLNVLAGVVVWSLYAQEIRFYVAPLMEAQPNVSPAERLLGQAEAQMRAAETKQVAEEKLDLLKSVWAILQEIMEAHPSNTLAVRLKDGCQVGKLSLSLDAVCDAINEICSRVEDPSSFTACSSCSSKASHGVVNCD